MKQKIPQELNARLNQAIKHAQLEIIQVKGVQLALLQQRGINGLVLETSEINQFWQTMPYWAFAWACGQAMVEFIQANPEYVANKRVLDLGAGSGLVAIKAASLGAKKVYISDLDTYAHKAAHFNARLNQQRLLDWQNEPVDILLGSDLLYDISAHPSLQKLVVDIPESLLAETPKAIGSKDSIYAGFKRVQQSVNTTTPNIAGFDEALKVDVFYHKQINKA